MSKVESQANRQVAQCDFVYTRNKYLHTLVASISHTSGGLTRGKT